MLMFTIIDDPNPDIAKANLDVNTDAGTLVVESRGTDHEGRTQYRYEIWIDGVLAESGDDLRTGVHIDSGPEAMLATLATFLGAAAESYAYTMRTGTKGENNDLFTPKVVEWAYQHSDELSMLADEIENPPED